MKNGGVMRTEVIDRIMWPAAAAWSDRIFEYTNEFAEDVVNTNPALR